MSKFSFTQDGVTVTLSIEAADVSVTATSEQAAPRRGAIPRPAAPVSSPRIGRGRTFRPGSTTLTGAEPALSFEPIPLIREPSPGSFPARLKKALSVKDGVTVDELARRLGRPRTDIRGAVLALHHDHGFGIKDTKGRLSLVEPATPSAT